MHTQWIKENGVAQQYNLGARHGCPVPSAGVMQWVSWCGKGLNVYAICKICIVFTQRGKTILSKAQSGSGKMTRHQTVEGSGMGGGSDWMAENVKAAIFSPLARCRSHQLDREKIMRPANYFEVCICIW